MYLLPLYLIPHHPQKYTNCERELRQRRAAIWQHNKHVRFKDRIDMPTQADSSKSDSTSDSGSSNLHLVFIRDTFKKESVDIYGKIKDTVMFEIRK